MAVTHTWSVVRADHETATNKIKSIHWELRSADGDHKAYSCGEVRLPSSVVLPYASLTSSLLVKAAHNNMKTNKDTLQADHESKIAISKAGSIQHWTA